MPIQQRGLDQDQEQTTGALLRDTRTLGQRVSEFLKNPSNVAALLLFFGATGFIFPAVVDLTFIIGVILFLISKTQHYSLPFRMPK